MARIRSRDTGPEMTVRRLLHAMGCRYRLHRRDLPGSPDIVFASRKLVILVHGCFWHRHPDPGCRNAVLPKSNTDFWLAKLNRNVTRDAEVQLKLAALGYRVLVVWECETGNGDALQEKLRAALGDPGGGQAAGADGVD
jgi:DNA mismatch endonuclease (patch repair protein)